MQELKLINFVPITNHNNGSDHVDPHPYLAKWGISREQFKKDIESGITEGNWKRNEVGWWWEESDGSYPKSQWEKNIKGEWFYFDNRGYCFINKWFNDGKDWFYFDKRGAAWLLVGCISIIGGITLSRMVEWLKVG